ncbi:hypothetical protein LGM71_04920 [Burkholderia sp. AU33545]|uniref:hypothetical protein n=1 Tax=Burkholderia TaxID=32008 RepID=UPI001582625E|nr:MULTISPECIES: hypothetical protein [Burkholderia]MBM2651244.1 hypothetical protein [Burkholderia diffusa]MCA8200381.1 hypothetical protein [Burkholderia sp. AU33545]
MTAKAERTEHTNQLIKAIGSDGRHFFYNPQHDRYARIELDSRGRVWFVDDYTDKRVCTHDTRGR